MSNQCEACNERIVPFDFELQGISRVNKHGFYDGVLEYCSSDCAPAELTGRSYDQPPLEALVEFFYESNTDKSLEYWTETRGWSQDIVDKLQLGWAPADEYAAFTYLKDKGYSNADILSTGAFYPGNPPYQCIWTGRLVFPYYGANGDPEYLISRRYGEDGHEADSRSEQKYAKLTKTKPYAIHDEPIYGIESIPDADFVLITEGIADAITAIEHGYPVLSPVTVSFKEKHYEKVADLLDEHSIDTVYIVPDAEEIQDAQEESGLDVSVGLYGGLKTAVELEDRASSTIQIVELPRDESVSKVDLDDFLKQNGKAAFESVLETASAPQSFEAYTKIRDRTEKMKQAARERQETADFDASETDYSELFDLSILDVLPPSITVGTRHPNPLGHIGDSEDYFLVTQVNNDYIAYDHKRKVSYNALTYILCEIGERSPESPNGPISDKELWLAWKHCKEENIFTDENDPIPSRALTHIARELGYTVDSDELLPYEVYTETLSYIESEYDINPGRTATATKSSSDDSSTYFEWPVGDIVDQIETELPAGFDYTGSTWTADEVEEYVDSLALIAFYESYLELDSVSSDWTQLLSPVEFLELCLKARQKYNVSASIVPRKAIIGMAEVIGINPYDDDGDNINYKVKQELTTAYKNVSFYYDASEDTVKYYQNEITL